MSANRVRRALPGSLKAGGAILALLAIACLAGPLLTRDPAEVLDPAATALLPPGSVRWVAYGPASPLVAERATRTDAGWQLVRMGSVLELPPDQVSHVNRHLWLLGGDTVGRDVLARVLAGGRVSLGVGALGLLVALLLGVLVGMTSGLARPLVDGTLMRLTDALLAVPLLFLLVFLAAVLRPSAAVLAVVLGTASWMGVARLVRGQVRSLKEREFVLALRGLGLGRGRIALRHLLPNAVAPLSQDAALRLGDLILVEASMSFLGLGVQPPTPSWGNLVAEGQTVLTQAWWLTLIPSLLVLLTVVAAALVADGFQELLHGETRA